MTAPSLRELIDLGAPAVLERYAPRLGAEQRRALQALAQCRTGALGTTEMACDDCGHAQLRPRSCGHRACPRCQHHHCAQWLERQRAKLLPVSYFMVTFTLPSALRSLAYRHPRETYNLLFSTAIDTLMTFSENHRELRGELGATAVLHTHNRRLDYHPHLHVIVPAGALDRKRRQWRTLAGNYLFNGRALGQVFRARFLDALRRSPLRDHLPAVAVRWIVHCQRVGSGLPALKYLARYLYRGVLREQDLVDFDPERELVTFRYRDAKTRRWCRRTLALVEFLCQLLVHVLPRGLCRVRHYGLLHGNAKRRRALLQLLLRVVLAPTPPPAPQPFLCPHCGHTMRPLRFLQPRPT